MSEPLPSGWMRARVGDLARADEQPVLTGPFGTNMGREDFVSKGCPVLTIGCLTDSGIRLDKAVYVRPDKAAELERYKLRTGDLLFSRMASVGRAGMVPSELDGALFDYHIMRLRLSESLMLPELFLAYVRGAPAVRKYLEDVNHGATRDGINTAQLVDMPVTVPPLNEQRRIVAKLEALQARSRRAREALEAVPPLLEKLRQSILAAAFRGDLTKDWREKHPDVEPASELLKRIRIERRKKWEEAELAKMKVKGKTPADDRWKAKYVEPKAVDATGLPELPGGWTWASVEELVIEGPSNGFSPKSDRDGAGTPTLKLSATTSGYCLLNENTTKRTIEAVANDEPYWLAPCDVLVQRANTIEYVGVAAIFDGPERTFIYPDLMMRLRASPVVGPRLLWRELSWDFCRKYMRDRATGTAGNMPKVNGETVRRVPIPLPPLQEQSALLDRLDEAVAIRVRVERLAAGVIVATQSLERSVLAKAFSGEFVPQDPNDETTEVMLARLQGSNPAHESEISNRKRSRDASAEASRRNSSGIGIAK